MGFGTNYMGGELEHIYNLHFSSLVSGPTIWAVNFVLIRIQLRVGKVSKPAI
jgi:hypothetical protein